MTETCGPDEYPKAVFLEIKGIKTKEEQFQIYNLLKGMIQSFNEKSFQIIELTQKEGFHYNKRRICDNHETLFEIHGTVTSG